MVICMIELLIRLVNVCSAVGVNFKNVEVFNIKYRNTYGLIHRNVM